MGGRKKRHKKSELVRSKAIKKHHTHGREKGMKEASEKLTLGGPLSPFYYSGYCDVAG